ncbi:hypothetical protein MNBD_GAMMA07-1784 [hydrothermal vent metagenome]|uniref:Uncharacterized protein n=1 Tax=hydrothermal vent metagenome TaxID=652676 RepID=A0A3B0WXB0_9ZZZZ
MPYLKLTEPGDIKMEKIEAKQVSLIIGFNLFLAGVGLIGMGNWVVGLLILLLAFFVYREHL